MDRAEEEFPFQESTLFRGMEQIPELLTDPRSLRDGYLEQLQLFTTELEQGCRRRTSTTFACEPTGRWGWRIDVPGPSVGAEGEMKASRVASAPECASFR